ncbi:GHKL domain-containing protein [candidate division KSB1 bacterium]|nr:GHKL domain-containing protein [candidate division KSB1 bacterium]
MVYKRFRFIIIGRIFLLMGSIFLLFFICFYYFSLAFVFIVALAILYQTYLLIHYIETTNRDLSRFFDSIKYADFSQSFSAHQKGKTFQQLYQAINAVIHDFHQARREKEEQYRYLQTVVQHIGVGIIVIKMNDEVDLINNAAKRLLKISHLRKLDQLNHLHPQFVEKIISLKPGTRTLFKFTDKDDFLQLAIYATDFTMHQQKYRLISLQNIQSELEEKEMEAWQNLIRVLTHEIMNSVTPISSLASTARHLLNRFITQASPDPVVNSEIMTDVESAVQTIERRSLGLLTFVENYRKLTKIPRPDFQIFLIKELFQRIINLMQPQFSLKNFHIDTQITPESLELTADPLLVEQVLINLIKNALEAMTSTPQPMIHLTARLDERGRILIEVADNGGGIQQNVLENIFIPFFTTKEQGSGIGLSLSRQIMRLHGGTITVRSIPNRETVFTLRF